MKKGISDYLIHISTVGGFVILAAREITSLVATPLKAEVHFRSASLPTSTVAILSAHVRENDEFANALRDRPMNLNLYARSKRELQATTRQWMMSVSNTGSQKLTGVSVGASGALEARISREGGVVVDTAIGGVLQLGDLAPNERLALTLWLGGSSDDFTESEKPQLVHDAGIGAVLVLREVGTVGQLADAYFWPLVQVMLWLSFSLGAGQLHYEWSHRRALKKADAEAKLQQDRRNSVADETHR